MFLCLYHKLVAHEKLNFQKQKVHLLRKKKFTFLKETITLYTVENIQFGSYTKKQIKK